MSRTLTLRDILEFCGRQSGRTSTIIKDITSFLLTDKDDAAQIIIVVCNNKMTDFYFRELDLTCGHSPLIKFSRAESSIKNSLTNRMVKIINSESLPDHVRGLKYKDVYFDTPEIDVFDYKMMGPLIAGLRDD